MGKSGAVSCQRKTTKTISRPLMSGSAYGTNPSGGEQELAFFDGNKSSSLQGDMGATQQSGGSDNPFSNTSNMQPITFWWIP